MFFFLDTFPDSASWRLLQILCALQGFYLHEEGSVEQEVAKFARDSLVVFNEKAVRKIYAPICFQSRLNGDKKRPSSIIAISVLRD